MAKWLLVDGYNLAYRCFFAVPELSRADGFPTNALHGWVKSLWRLSDQEKPDGVLVFFDLGGAQDRLALLPEYKAQREEMPEPLARQVPVIKAASSRTASRATTCSPPTPSPSPAGATRS